MVESLKEEIKERLTAMIDRYGNFEDDFNQSTDDILQIFQKRIDVLLEQSNKYEWVNALMQVKEMLK